MITSRPNSEQTDSDPEYGLRQQRAITEVAARCILGGSLAELRQFAVQVLAEALDAEAVSLLQPAGVRLVILAQTGLVHLDALSGDVAELETPGPADPVLFTAEHGPCGRAVKELLQREGHHHGVMIGFAKAPAQLLVASRGGQPFEGTGAGLLRSVSRILTMADQRCRAEELAQRRLRQQQAAAVFGQFALATDDPGEVMQEATRVVTETLGVGRASVLERTGEYMIIRAATGWSEDVIGHHLPAKQVLSSAVIRSNEPLIVNDLSNDERFPTSLLSNTYSTGSLMVVPIAGPLQAVATLTAISERTVSYDADDLAFMRGMANVIAMTMERGRTHNQLHLSIEELRKSAEDRSKLLTHLVEAQEEERQRIANDIHDDSVQVMTAVALRLATIRRRLGADPVDPVLLNLERDVRQSIARLRHLMFVLNPPALDAHGLNAALHAFMTQIGEDTGLQCSLESYLSVEPESQARTIAYRIAQEAVTNVCKHAQATRIDVVLGECGDGIFVEVRDDGVGFDPEHPDPSPPGHMGLLAMRERAEQSGGWWTVASEHAVGTTIRFSVGSQVIRERNQNRLATVAAATDASVAIVS